MPIRVQLSRKKGAKLPPNTTVVARPSRWGNPYKLMPGRTPAMVIHSFRDWIETNMSDHDRSSYLAPLRGKNLACWCKLDAPCHADVLLELANKP
jgi:hypothetical protein